MFDAHIEGKWYNPHTGHSFEVKDTFFENDKFMVMTTEGQLLDTNVFESYIQVDKDFVPGPMNLGTITELPPEVVSMLEVKPIEAPQAIYNECLRTSLDASHTPVESEDTKLIKRILKKAPDPKLSISVDWKISQKQLDMLDMLDISLDSLVEYYISSLSIEDIKESYKRALSEVVNPEPKPKTKKR